MESNEVHHLCIACRKAIPAGATKCATCGSYQNWRRYLVISDTSLSLLIALFSVLGIVSPIFFDAFSVERSKMNALIAADDQGAIRVLVSNEGSANGFLRDVSLIVDGSSHVVHPGEFEPILGGSSKAILFFIDDALIRFMGKADKCVIQITLLESNLLETPQDFEVDCKSLNKR